MSKPNDVSQNINGYFFIQAVDNGVSVQYRDKNGQNRINVIEKRDDETLTEHADRVDTFVATLITEIKNRVTEAEEKVADFIFELKNSTEEENAEE